MRKHAPACGEGKARTSRERLARAGGSGRQHDDVVGVQAGVDGVARVENVAVRALVGHDRPEASAGAGREHEMVGGSLEDLLLDAGLER